MADDEIRDEVQPKDAGRRTLLKAATVAGGAVAASALLPGSWRKPVATIGGLPAHAQTSDTITLSNPNAFYGGAAPDGAAEDGNWITASCNYQDALGEFGGDHQVTITVGQADFRDAAAEPGACGVPVTYTLSDLEPYFAFSGGPVTGNLKFAVNSVCFPPGSISWYIHKGAGHRSNVVNASIIVG